MRHVLKQSQVTQFRSGLIADEKSAATVEKYLHDVRAFVAHVGLGGNVTKEVVIAYKQHLMERYAPSSVNTMLAALNRFFKELGWYDCVVKALRIQRQVFRDKGRELSREEYCRLLAAAQARGDRRMYLLMETICATGIRVSELQFITLEAAQNGYATVSLKGKTRKVLLPRALCRKLKRYAKERNIRKGCIFITRSGAPMDRSNILHAMKALCRQAGVERSKVFPHNLRHLFACCYYQAEKDISRLADLLGHSSINTTRIYTSVSGAEQVRQIERLGLVV